MQLLMQLLMQLQIIMSSALSPAIPRFMNKGGIEVLNIFNNFSIMHRRHMAISVKIEPY